MFGLNNLIFAEELISMNVCKFHLLCLIIISCGQNPESKASDNFKLKAKDEFKIEYANGFDVEIIKGGYILKITEAWPEAEKSFTYLLQNTDQEPKTEIEYDYKIKIPIESIVVTSTTHIPSLDTLGVLDKLVGFPNTDYISSAKARSLIEANQIKEVGQNESLNTELLVELNPDAVVTFAVKGQNKSVESIKQAGIPILYNADWVESEPLGKAEWIKFFGLLFDEVEKSQQIFNSIKIEYERVKTLAENTNEKPTVLSGALWKDQWYLPAGESWQAQLISDANAKYLYADTEGTGSLSLSFESVFAEANGTEFWVGPGQYTSYNQMLEQQSHYGKFKAFQDKNIYTFASTLGENGGVLYYELAPNRPDLVLKDLISIFHPELLKGYKNRFFKPLNP